MNKFIFDVDGTLTPSRREIEPDFKNFFSNFCEHNNVYLVTGSDFPKTHEQLGDEIINKVKRIYNCSGNDVWEKGKNLRSSDWTLPEEQRDWLTEELVKSPFPLRTGLHIEERPGMINFSVVGRNATLGERKIYVEYEINNKERVSISKRFMKQFTNMQAVVGGETGIDIFPQGSDKSQILVDFDEKDYVYFFGDRMDVDGNDYPLKIALWKSNIANRCVEVEGWEDTWFKLKDVT